MKKRRRVDAVSVILTMLCIIFIVGGLVMLGIRFYQGYKSKETGDKAKDAVESVVDKEFLKKKNSGELKTGSPVPPEMLAKLQEVFKNDEIIAYLVLEGTGQEYPIVQCEDNDKYLHTDLSGNYSIYGSIFLDYRNKSDFTGSRSVVYGHNMRNGTMFGSFRDVYTKDLSGQAFNIYTRNKVLRYDVLCSTNLGVDGGKEYVGYEDDISFRNFISTLQSSKFVWNSEVPYTENSKFCTLMTCWGDGSSRLAVVGVLQDQDVSY